MARVKPREDGQFRDVRVPMLMAKSEVEAVDDWRFAHRIGSRAEAIRQLIDIGLQAQPAKNPESERS